MVTNYSELYAFVIYIYIYISLLSSKDLQSIQEDVTNYVKPWNRWMLRKRFIFKILHWKHLGEPNMAKSNVIILGSLNEFRNPNLQRMEHYSQTLRRGQAKISYF